MDADKQDLKKIWEILDNKRNELSVFDRDNLISVLDDANVEVTPEIIDTLLNKRMFRDTGEYSFPTDLASFIGLLLRSYGCKNLLYPWEQMGTLPIVATRELAQYTSDIYFRNETDIEIFRRYKEASKHNAVLGDPMQLLAENNKKYDAVIASPPINLLPRSEILVCIGDKSRKVKDNLDANFICKCCEKLTDDGIGIFIVPQKYFLDSRKDCARSILNELGMQTSVCLEIPSKLNINRSSVLTYLIVIQKHFDDFRFVGRISSDNKHQNALIQNILKRQDAEKIPLGRLISPEEFFSVRALEANEYAKQLAKRQGKYKEYKFREIILEFNRPNPHRNEGRLDEKSNSVYLPLISDKPCVCNISELSEGCRHYVQLVVDPEITNASFLAGYLNSKLGILIRDTARVGGSISQIMVSRLQDAVCYLPPLNTQNKVEMCLNEIVSIKNKITELENAIWEKPSDIENTLKVVNKVKFEETFEQWLEYLPFPLASILWSYHTTKKSIKDKYERLLHFFEAFAEFIATVHLSAYYSDNYLWEEVKEEINELLQKQNFSIELATFGLWKNINEYLSKKTRKIFHTSQEENSNSDQCFELYSIQNKNLIETLCSKELINILSKTNSIRNSCLGHVGIIGDEQAETIHNQLSRLLLDLRAVIGTLWKDYQLIIPQGCKYKSGVFHYTAQIIMGTRTPFQTEEFELTEGMEDGVLHLLGENESKALELLPLVKIMPSPRSHSNACYFYNRKESNGNLRYLSYYFEADSEIIQSFEDTSTFLIEMTSNE